MSKPKVLIITGPTASGKTQLSEMMAAKYPCEIINADVGQFYKPLSIGTAKPDLTSAPYKHHLFDLLDSPQDLSVVKYRDLVIALVNDICQRGKIPVIVGGSLFYIKSLFFPPRELHAQAFPVQELPAQNVSAQPLVSQDLEVMDSAKLWEFLKEIDPERASKLHPNDNYRIRRALEIWIKTGEKPSGYKPKFEPAFDALIICVQPDVEILKKRICLRTVQMIDAGGWIEESEQLINTQWEEFLKIKNLIGYTEIFDWIRSGKNKSELPDLIAKIQIKTTQYAKRQRTFWVSFEKEIKQNLAQEFTTESITVGFPDEQALNQIISVWQKI